MTRGENSLKKLSKYRFFFDSFLGVEKFCQSIDFFWQFFGEGGFCQSIDFFLQFFLGRETNILLSVWFIFFDKNNILSLLWLKLFFAWRKKNNSLSLLWLKLFFCVDALICILCRDEWYKKYFFIFDYLYKKDYLSNVQITHLHPYTVSYTHLTLPTKA